MFFKLQELAAFPRLFYFFSKKIFMFLSFFFISKSQHLEITVYTEMSPTIPLYPFFKRYRFLRFRELLSHQVLWRLGKTLVRK